MPLLPGQNNFSHNVKEMVKAGHPIKQAVAASYEKLREEKKRKRKEGR